MLSNAGRAAGVVRDGLRIPGVEVAITGAGPVGLFLAVALQRYGRSVAVLEQNAGPSPHSKALAYMPRSLEIMQMAGIVGELLARGNRLDAVRVRGARGTLHVSFAHLPTRYPYVLVLPQSVTERTLLACLRDLGADVRYGTRLESFVQDGEGVELRLRGAQGEERLHCRFLVGCDGAHSVVRERAGIAFEGAPYPEGAALADAVVRTAMPANEALVDVSRPGVLTLFPVDERVRRLVVAPFAPESARQLTREYLQNELDVRGLEGTRVEELSWSSVFRLHRRVAGAMRRANVLLAGDAAHIHSPVGGQGLNAGFADAWNLAWKLAAELEGRAAVGLLDSYEAERLPVARAIVRRTDLLTRLAAGPGALARLARVALLPLAARVPAASRALVRELSQLELGYAGSPLVCGRGERVADERLADGLRLYDRLGSDFVLLAYGPTAPPAGPWNGLWALHVPAPGRPRAVLVRPDGYAGCVARAARWPSALRAAAAWKNRYVISG